MSGKLKGPHTEAPAYVEAKRAYQQRWYLANREQLKARASARYSIKRESILAKEKERRARARGYAKPQNVSDHGIPRKDPRYYVEIQAAQALRRRFRALQTVSGQARPACARCGQDDWRVLEINHLLRALGFVGMASAIINGQRLTGDLNVLCCSCNRLYEYERGNRCLPRDWQAIIKEEIQRGQPV